ncbi:hypothetical protein PLA107_030490 (plasmid) [Pseudomonas amygdali pv. lachrymans str. M301315]|uniref:Uncharacterized protein n=3 Tax=Pseudomonas amygdali TaxID=47877 RepID=A0ABR5KQC7_PSEAV|nr:hypothetical protein PLA107_030490 [Pseudomonas amygdali pv. lachrymans str. M301315]KPC16984.1 Uncharacterized protein AC499_0186 [Pseudomonas amygdali pv. lachrymans]KPC17943.1 Uncharacterized protein AC499_1145 [Pseudomonas amygdali pv. lachrymans]
MDMVSGLPSYTQPYKNVTLDQATLSKGHLQEEAIRFFTHVAQKVAPGEIKQAFQAIIDDYPGVKHARPFYAVEDNFLIATVALALLKDIGPLAPYIINDYVPLGAVSDLLKGFADGIEIDLVDQLTRKGELDLKMFCMVYSIRLEDLTIKTVLDDNPQAFDAILQEQPDLAYKVLACVPYDPLSSIRCHLTGQPGKIPLFEMKARIDTQYTAIRSQNRQFYDPNKPSVLQPEKGLSCKMLEAVDLQLRILPGYLITLKDHQDELLESFGYESRQSMGIDSERMKLIFRLSEDFEEAGVSRVDILMKGVMNFQPAAVDPHQDTPLDELEARYLAKTQDERQALYLPMLIESSAHFGDFPDSWQAQPKLLHLNHFIRKEPIDQLEALCTTSSHWNALYRATGDRKYVAKLGDRSERVLSEDLGL